jgi:(2Fe-2S) ferredoxin
MRRYGLQATLVVTIQLLIVNTPVAALTIQVCQNKDCCKRYKMQSMNLVHTIYNLLPPSSDRKIHVESTGCLSQCEKGPNIAFKQDNNKEEPTIYNGICDHFSAAAVLPIVPPATLLAAVSVMEKAEKGTY